ncbi:MAG: iron-sulfur cluster repair di-iron protein [Ignavibacteriae bacterium]|nr:iron-sulfur cluster repair di-iron protein [Ignavibacteriota bacterium]
MTDVRALTLKQIVTDNFRAAAVFEKYSLDFCCRGGKTIDEACGEKSLNAETVLADLGEAMAVADQSEVSFDALPLDELIDYIVLKHHTYVRNAIPVLAAHTAKVSSVHGANHPEAVAIAGRFAVVANELQHHMMKEERILFPYIKHLVDASNRQFMISAPPFGSAQNPIRMMEAEHESAGDEMYGIRALSASYTPPDDACTTFRTSYKELEDFEKDLHQHIHLENNILFPKSLALEAKVLSMNN